MSHTSLLKVDVVSLVKAVSLVDAVPEVVAFSIEVVARSLSMELRATKPEATLEEVGERTREGICTRRW